MRSTRRKNIYHLKNNKVRCKRLNYVHKNMFHNDIVLQICNSKIDLHALGCKLKTHLA